jgi:methionyl-tRNA formyltransferase
MVDSIVFAGTPENAAQTLAALVAGGIDVALVITRTDALVGRKAIPTESAVATKARELGLITYKTNSIDALAIERIIQTGSELGLIVAYGSILDSKALGCLSKGWFNLHYSLLPQLRGAAPVQHALIRGFKETGVTLFKLDAGIDTGSFVSQVPTKIELGETSSRLLGRLTVLGCSLLLQELPGLLAGTYTVHPQAGSSSPAPKLRRADAKLDFMRDATELEALILGCNPEPGAWALHGEAPIKIHDAFAVESSADATPGEVYIHQTRVEVRCGVGSLVLKSVQPAGRQPMSAEDWFRGKAEKVRFT